MEQTHRRSISDTLSIYETFEKDSAFIEVTEWANMSGWDIVIEGNKSERFSLSSGEFKGLVKLINELEK